MSTMLSRPARRAAAQFVLLVLSVAFVALFIGGLATAQATPSTPTDSAQSALPVPPYWQDQLPPPPAAAQTPYVVNSGQAPVAVDPPRAYPTVGSSDGHYVRGKSVEDPSARTQTTKRFINPDGTTSLVASTVPLHYRDATGAWKDIDTSLVGDGTGAYHSKANAWHATFGPLASGVVIDTAAGRVRFAPSAAASTASPELLPDGSGVVYRDAWSNADLRYRVQPDGVKEEIVLKTRSAASSYQFDTGGVTYESTADGGLTPSRAARELGSIPPPLVLDTTGAPQLSANPTLTPSSSALAGITVALDPGYLANVPDSAFPVILDPTWTANAVGPYTSNYKSDGTTCNNCGTQVGNSRDLISGVNYDRYWRNVSYFDYTGAYGQHIQNATVQLGTWQAGTQNGYTISVYAAGASSYAGALNGSALATVNDGSDTTSATITGAGLTSTFDNWAYNSIPSKTLGFVGQEQPGLYTYKKFGSASVTLTYQATVPNPPYNVAGVANHDGSATISWHSPTNDGGAPIDGYNVKMYHAGDNPATTQPWATTFCSGVNCAASTWFNLTEGSRWFWTVTAHNVMGNSSVVTSNSVTVVHYAGTPGTPASYAGNAQALVTWKQATVPGGTPAIDSYQLTAVDETNSAYNVSATACATCTSYTFLGLRNGDSYHFTIKAHNADGVSDTPATTSPAITPSTTATPYPPQNTGASPGNGTAYIMWDAPAPNGGPALDSYVVQKFQTACGSGSYTSQTVSPQAALHQSYTWTGLANGTTYCFRVFSHNSTNYGGYADTNTVVPLATPPPFPPRDARATAGDSMVLVQWSAPDPSGPAPSSYVVAEYDQAIGYVTQQTVTAPGTVALFSATNGHTYGYLIYASNANGTSTAAATAWVTPQSGLATFNKPTNVQAVRGNTTVSVTWNAPVAAIPGVTTYTVRAYLNCGNVQTGSSPTVTDPTHNATITGLKNGTSVCAVVTTNNLTTNGSGTSNPVTPAGPPFAPENVSATRGDRSVTVSWQPPSARADGTPGNNGDASVDRITSYTVSVRTANGNQTVTSTTVSESDGNPPPTTVMLGCPDHCLTNGTQYYASVNASNDIGGGPASNSAPFTPAGVPFAPTNVHATTGERTQSTVTWAAGADNGDPITGFTVTAHPDSGSDISRQAASSPFVFPDLTGGTGYTFSVTATNGVGTSAPSPSSERVIPVDVPGPANDLAATPHDGYVAVSWTQALDHGSPVQSYTVTEEPEGISQTIASSTTSSVYDSQFSTANGVEHTYAVYATNLVGDGPTTSTDTVAAAGPPGDVLNVRASRITESSAVVRWSRAVPNGAPVTYTVSADPGGASVSTAGDEATLTGLSQGTYSFTVTADNGFGITSAQSNSVLVVPVAPHHISVEEDDSVQRLSGCSDCFYRVYRSDMGVILRVLYHDPNQQNDVTSFYINQFGDDVDKFYWSHIQQCVQGGAPSLCVAAGYIAATRDTNPDHANQVADDDCAQHSEDCDLGAVIPDDEVDGFIGSGVVSGFTMLFAPEAGIPIAADLATLDGNALFSEGVDAAAVAQYASDNGLASVDDLLVREGATLSPYDATDPFVVQQYDEAIKEVAQNARGVIRVLSDDALAPGTVFNDITYPALTSNPNVMQVVEINPSTGQPTVLFTNWDTAGPAIFTDYDDTLLWTGLGENGEAISDAYATDRELETLHMILQRLGVEVDTADDQFFVNASRWIAREAHGEVRVLSSDAFANPDSFFVRYEYPELQTNPNVTRVVQIDPNTGQETTILER